MAVVEGIIDEIIYRNEENGYTVLTVTTDSEDVTLVGTMFNVTSGEEVKAKGDYVSHHIYGMQLKVEEFECFMPKKKSEMEKYLASGVIKGIGPSLAKRIVELFGKDTFNVFESEPERLAEVKGISQKKAQEIAVTFYEQKHMRRMIIFLQQFGISLTYAVKIYNRYKEKTIDIVKANPYRLAEDIQGIGFKMSDSIATRLGFDLISSPRIMAGIQYVLLQAANDGHLFLDEEHLLKYAKSLLNIELVNIENALLELQLNGNIIVKNRDGRQIVYLEHYYKMEQYIARKLFDLSEYKIKEDKDIVRDIKSIEKNYKITLDDYQKDAVKDALTEGVMIITGGPGTGKTTTINTIIEALKMRDQDVLLAAPTGRAAKRMTETTGEEAKTIHRLLEISFGNEESNQKFDRNEDYPLECDVVIVDESSMIDVSLMYYLLKAIAVGTRLILVGDKDQLPSVGPGNILRDIIHARYIKTVKLEKIFRQALESDIIINAHKINNGEKIEITKEKKDFFFANRSNANDILKEVISLVKTRLPKFASCDSIEDIQILTPMRKGILGVDNLNIELQKHLNPPSKDLNEKEYRKTIFRENDKVMQIRNNYNISWEIYSQYKYKIDEGLGVFNGDVGKIVEINNFTEKLKVRFDDDKVVSYDFNNLDELELAYAITIHKSQGSEYKVVVMPMFQGPPMLMTRNLLYTGVTRAKTYVVLVGMQGVMNDMINNNREVNRNSSLEYMVNEVFESENY